MKSAMKHVTFAVMTACLGVASVASAQSDQEMIDRALLGAPAGMVRMNASVVKWGPDGKRVVIKQGTNDLVCWDQSVWPGQLPFSVHCTSSKSMDRVDQNRAMYYQYMTREAAEKAIKELETSGKRVLPEYGSGHYGLQGKDQASARAHVTIAVPNATAASMKVPDKPSTSGIWLMDAGTTGAHLMIPGN
jgi:hypothetical protein